MAHATLAGTTADDAAQLALDDPREWDAFTRWSGDANGRRGESTLRLSGIRCAACGPLIEETLESLPGVLDVRANAASLRLTLRWDPSRTQPSAWLGALQQRGYDAVPDVAGPAREQRRREQRRELWRLFVAAFCTMQVMMFATPAYVAAPGELDANLRQLLAWGGWLCSLPVLLFSAAPFLRGAAAALARRRLSMDVPVALGIAITFGASTVATFDPAGPLGADVYFDSMTMFVALLLGARALEMQARHRAAAALESAWVRLPETATRLDDAGRPETVAVRALRPGDLVRVALGEGFPADGEIEEGRTWVDESVLSGESIAVPRAIGQPVVAGSTNRGAPVLVRVQHVGADTRMQRIASLVQQAAGTRPRAARVADRIAGPFLWGVLLAAATAAAVWSLVDPARAAWVAVSALIVTCPCALTLAVPMTLVSATAGLARRGVIVLRSDVLEVLAEPGHLFIDKTGTLTLERPRLLFASGPSDEAERSAMLERAASLAVWSVHPVSRAIVAACPNAKAVRWRDVLEVAGQGVEALDTDGRRWRLGEGAWAGAVGEDPGTVALGVDGMRVASFAFEESLRDGAAEVLATLRREGWRITLLSGDTSERAHAVARQLEIDDVAARVTPEGKLQALRAARRPGGGPLVMLGDGVNDAPALAAADVSLAMGQGALMARAGADAVIASEHLWPLAELMRTARRARRIVRQNLWWAATYNVVAVPLAWMGWLPPWLAGAGMAASSALVALNALRAGR